MECKEEFRPLSVDAQSRRHRQLWVPSPFVMNNPHSSGSHRHPSSSPSAALTLDHEYHPLIFYLPERKQLACYTCCKEKKNYYDYDAPTRPPWQATTDRNPATWVVTYSTFPPRPKPTEPSHRPTTARPWGSGGGGGGGNPSTWVVTYSTFPPNGHYTPTTTRRPWTPTTQRPWARPPQNDGDDAFEPLDVNEIEVIDARKKAASTSPYNKWKNYYT